MSKISQLPALDPLDIAGEELVPVVKDGVNYRAQLDQLLAPTLESCETARDVALALTGPFADSEAEGLAATAEGAHFAVSVPGTGLVSAFRKVGGAALFRAALLTATTLLAPTAAAGIGTTQGPLQDLLDRGYFRVPADGLPAAMAAAAAGTPIILDAVYEISDPIIVTLTADMVVSWRPGARIVYTGPDHEQSLIRVNMAGHSLRVTGQGGTIDGANQVNVGWESRQETALASPTYDVSGFSVINVRMVSPASTKPASGIAFFGRAHIVMGNLLVDGVSRAAGSGSPGNRGCHAIICAESGALYPLSYTVGFLEVRNVSSEDLLASAANVDCDGVLFKVADGVATKMVIDRIKGVNCTGRVFKAQGINGSEPIIRLGEVERSVRKITGGAPEFDFQGGNGTIQEVRALYTGNGDDVHFEQSTIVDMSPRDANAPLNRYYGNGVVIDQTTGATTMGALFGAVPSAAAVAGGKVHTTSYGVWAVIGKAIKHIIFCGQTGAMSHLVKGQGFIGTVTGSLATVNAPCTGLSISISDHVNLGTSVPAVVRSDGAGLGITWGKHYDLGGNVGFHRHDGNHFAASTGSSLGPAFLNPTHGQYMPGADSRAIVRRAPAPITLAFGATSLLGDGTFGYSGYGARLKVRVPGSTLYACDLLINGSSGTVSNATHSLFTWAGVLAAAPTSPANQFIFWRSSVDSKYYVTSTFASGSSIIDVTQE